MGARVLALYLWWVRHSEFETFSRGPFLQKYYGGFLWKSKLLWHGIMVEKHHLYPKKWVQSCRVKALSLTYGKPLLLGKEMDFSSFLSFAIGDG